MAYEVSLEVVIDAKIEAPEVFNVFEIHVNMIDPVFLQEVHYLLVISDPSS